MNIATEIKNVEFHYNWKKYTPEMIETAIKTIALSDIPTISTLDKFMCFLKGFYLENTMYGRYFIDFDVSKYHVGYFDSEIPYLIFDVNDDGIANLDEETGAFEKEYWTIDTPINDSLFTFMDDGTVNVESNSAHVYLTRSWYNFPTEEMLQKCDKYSEYSLFDEYTYHNRQERKIPIGIYYVESGLLEIRPGTAKDCPDISSDLKKALEKVDEIYK